jgi:hypothetical protein
MLGGDIKLPFFPLTAGSLQESLLIKRRAIRDDALN